MKRLAIIASLTCSLLLVATATHAAPATARRGVTISAAELSAGQRAQLSRAVRRARRQPLPFQRLAAIRDRLPRLAAGQRGRLITFVRPLRSLGRDALLPMLAELALDAAPRGDLSQRVWLGWQVSLLEAVGSLRDQRAAPVLRAILAGNHPGAVLRGAAAGLGRLGRDQDVTHLIQLTRTDPAKARIIARALGQCRRAAMAKALGQLLLQHAADKAYAGDLALSLGQVGNVWAWKTPAVARSGEEQATRRAAMEALVEATPVVSTDLRERVLTAIRLVGHPQTLGTIQQQQRKATPAARAALQRLAAQVRKLGLLH